MTYKIKQRLRFFAGGAVAVSVLAALPVGVQNAKAGFSSRSSVKIESGESTYDAPPQIGVLYNIEVDESTEAIRDSDSIALDIRKQAMKEAALSYGARGGLAYRTYEIRRELDDKARFLDKVFDFRQLLIKAPSGFLIEPPVISEGENNVIVGHGGMEAAVTDRMFNINANVKIVTAPKTWRQYLEREWGEVKPPEDILIPQTREERAEWIVNINKGWVEGYTQAEDIFESDLAMLLSHYRGMVRYRILLAQGMISPTLAVQTDRGITGGGNELRIGDRAVQIIDIPQLIPESAEWLPENR